MKAVARAMLVVAMQLALSPCSAGLATMTKRGPLRSALHKKVGTTISLEFVPLASAASMQIVGEQRTTALTAPERLRKLSSELRGGREGQLASAIFTPDVASVATLAAEQATAKGDFPGPCPIVFCGEAKHASDAVAAGATGVVMRASERETAALSGSVEVVWHVESSEEIEAIAEAESSCYLLDGASADELLPSLPEGSLVVAAVDAMQADSAEVDVGRRLAAAGCKALLVRQACVGDDEDLAYATFAVKALKSKKSSTFNIDGHTGAVNGHFGGTRSGSASAPEDGWARVNR